MKIMREMLKRRQFIFGKQNINRHQPQVDDVVTSVYTQYNNASNILDEGAVDAVMKFCPSKTDVVNILKQDISENGGESTISEKDIEFVDTFIYTVELSEILKQSVKSIMAVGPSPSTRTYVYCVGYLYKFIGGTVNFNGETSNLADEEWLIAYPGPILTYKGKFPVLVATDQSATKDLEHFPYFEGIRSISPTLEFTKRGINGLFLVAIVTGLDIERTENQDPIPEPIIPRLGDIVEITPDTMKYVEYKPAAQAIT